MSKQNKLAVLISLSFALTPGIALAQGNGGGNGGGNRGLTTYLQSLPVENVDASEHYLLLHMREEEKLARDVYRVLYQQWQMPVFDNIAAAEQSHMDLVLWALTRYGIADPVPSDNVGDFRNPLFTALFQFATSFGAQSPIHALLVGAVIEDLDVVDLGEALRNTNNRDLDAVWQNLARGSRNHMRAFYPQLANLGFFYTGLYITNAELQAIVTTPVENRPVDENGVPLF